MLQNIVLRLYVSLCDIIQITTVTIIDVIFTQSVVPGNIYRNIDFFQEPTLAGSFNEALYISLNVLFLDSPPPPPRKSWFRIYH